MKRILLFLAILSASIVTMAQVRIPGPGGNSTAAAVGTFTAVQAFPATPAVTGGTTVSLTLTQSLGTGNLVVIQCRTTNPVAIVSVNVGGTAVPVYSTASGNLNTLFPADAYIKLSVATAGPIVITFSGNTGSPTSCYAHEVSLSAGTANLDMASSQLRAAQTTPVVGQTVATLSGSNDYMLEDNNTDYANTTGVTGTGWTTNPKFDGTNGPGWVVKLNSVVSTAPSFTVGAGGPGNANPTLVAFASDATACNDEAFIDFSGSTNGTTMTAALLALSTFGFPTTGTNNGWGLSTSPATGITFATAAALGPLHTNIRSCGDGTTRTGNSTLGYQYDYSNATNKTINFGFNGSGTKAAAGFFFQTSLTTQTAEDIAGFVPTLTNAAVGLQFNNGVLRIECFGGSVTTSDAATISSNTKYWVTLGIDTAVGGSLAVYETSTWTQIGTTATCAPGGWTATPPNQFKLGRIGGSADTPAATVFIDQVRINATGVLITP